MEGADIVDLWILSERQLATDPTFSQPVLSADEAAKAAGVRAEADRRRYALFRSALRRVLGSHLGIAPERVGLRAGAFGKPELCGGAEAAGLGFNLSHSGEMLAIAVAPGMAVGVDIEHLRCLAARDRLLRRVMSPAEQERFARLPAAERSLAFWRAWTRKEAYLKGRGVGLSEPLAGVSVTFGPDEPPRLIHADGRPQDPAIWSLHEVRPASDLLGALAVSQPGARLRLRGLGDVTRDRGHG